MKNIIGEIIIGPGVKGIYPWEMHTAMALRDVGYIVKFIPRHENFSTPDVLLNNTLFEFKSPEGDNIKCIENNLQKAIRRQSRNVVIDSCRVKRLKDRSILSYLRSRARRKVGLGRLIFVNRGSKVFDIK